MKARNGRIRGVVRAHGGDGDEAELTEMEPEEGAEGVRRHILDATVACFVEHGWSGANMSVIARKAQVTRGRIQYYFPTLDDLLRASIDHLNDEWRKKYFPLIEGIDDGPERFEAGLDVLWGLMQDPLHIARQELASSARTNPELAELMRQAAATDDAMNLAAARIAYPALAEKGDDAVRLARDFTLVFMEGLSLYRFSQDAAARRAEQLALLRTLLVSYWRSLGVGVAAQDGAQPAATLTLARPAAEPDEARQRALRLILEAAAALAGSATVSVGP